MTWGPGQSNNGAEVSMVSWFARYNDIKGREEIRPTIAVVLEFWCLVRYLGYIVDLI